MKLIEIEEWARRIVKRIDSVGQIEDSRVELKRDWPKEHSKAARRIAGHCNANAGEALLWLIGVDENSGVIGVAAQEMADWWPAVRAKFDGMAPPVRDVVVNFGGIDVVALLFDAGRAPFVVKNPQHGLQGGGSVEVEVPWRDATTVRSAKRDDLVRLLVPRQALPQVSVVASVANLEPRQGHMSFHCSLVVYAVVPMGQTVVLPDHQTSGVARIGAETIELDIDLVAKKDDGLHFPGRRAEDRRVHTVLQGDNQVILEGPGFFRVIGRANIKSPPVDCEQLTINATIRPAGNELSFPIDASMSFSEHTSDVEHYEFHWR
ncbi:hypothetical protein ACSNOB_21865 [Micromonospora sp. URMC 106]|uniref:hypothetical protein n=1 Tax=Micromonospora sp. URMC 106 TaxID=3423408 RepID=UPI003F1C64CD